MELKLHSSDDAAVNPFHAMQKSRPKAAFFMACYRRFKSSTGSLAYRLAGTAALAAVSVGLPAEVILSHRLPL